MSDVYYTHVRHEITTLLPARLGRVLDVGCGSGETLRWLKQTHPDIETTGVEYNPQMRDALSRNVDHAHIGAIADALPRLEDSYDTIFCLDVLEHVPDSDAALAGLASKLKPDGAFIISLPNIAHYSVSLPLLRRKFPYADAGILDRTHLRFFVEGSIVDFVNKAGLHIDAARLSGIQGPKTKLLNAATLGLFKHHLAKQYIFRARKGAGPQPPIDWVVL